MIIRKEVNVSAKYFPNPIFPDGADYFPSIEGGISFRQATFSNNHLYADNRKNISYFCIEFHYFSPRQRERLFPLLGLTKTIHSFIRIHLF